MKRPRRFRNTGILISVLAVLCLVMAACGKKAPPVPPNAPALPPVAHVKHHVDKDNRLTLAWAPIEVKGSDTVAGYTVMRSMTRLDRETCDGCPILFERVSTLGPGTTEYREKLTPGMRYIYKVLAFTTYHAWSPDSGLIRVTVPAENKGDS